MNKLTSGKTLDELFESEDFTRLGGLEQRTIAVKVVVFAAQGVLHIIEAGICGDPRPRRAIETTKVCITEEFSPKSMAAADTAWVAARVRTAQEAYLRNYTAVGVLILAVVAAWWGVWYVPSPGCWGCGADDLEALSGWLAFTAIVLMLFGPLAVEFVWEAEPEPPTLERRVVASVGKVLHAEDVMAARAGVDQTAGESAELNAKITDYLANLLLEAKTS